MASWNTIDWTCAMEDEIRRVYEAGERGGNKRLARKFNLNPRAISARAARLGLPPLIATHALKVRGGKWRQAEIDLIVAHPLESIPQMRARLYRNGYSRSLATISILRYQLRREGKLPAPENVLADADLLSVIDVAKVMGVDHCTVFRWIQKGLLKTHSSDEGPRQYLVSITQLRQFLVNYRAHWDHRKTDKWFLVDTLVYQQPRKHCRNDTKQEVA